MRTRQALLAQEVGEEDLEVKTGEQLICCTESTMKEFDEHFVGSLLEGGKGKSQMYR
jgi:hypothetical protein